MANQLKGDALRYHGQIDLADTNNSRTQLVLLAGERKRVLEVGPATGYISEALRSRGCTVTGIEIDPAAATLAAEFCERMIVGDIEKLDLQQELREERFDVIMFGDVLEHLMDPAGMLLRVRDFLAPGGYVVASVPNVAHGSVRLMLLAGLFGYTETGLLDRTHLRFFTRNGLASLFEQAGYQIKTWRHTTSASIVDPLAPEVQLKESDFPPQLLEAVRQDPECAIYQFVVKAHPRREPRRHPSTLNGSRLALEKRPAIVESLWRAHQAADENQQALASLRAALGDSEQLLEEHREALEATEIALH